MPLPAPLQFLRHFAALIRKRFQNFKRDVKGLCFLIMIPGLVTLGAVVLVRVRVPCPGSSLPLHLYHLSGAGCRRRVLTRLLLCCFLHCAPTVLHRLR